MRVLAALFLLVMSSRAEDWTIWIRRGQEACRQVNYPEAAEAFRNATELNPNAFAPHLYLGMAWFIQYIPGAESPQNLEFARKAEGEFAKSLELDPSNLQALEYQASLSFLQRKWDDAVVRYRRVIAIDARNKQAYYTLGVIAWSRLFPRLTEALTEVGMTPDSPGPIPPSPARVALVNEFSSAIDDGMANLQKALEIDPDYDDAMAYLTLLIRGCGSLRESWEEWARDVATGDEWLQRNLKTKRKKARARKGPPPLGSDDWDATIRRSIDPGR